MLETEPMLGCMLGTTRIQRIEQGFITTGGLLLIEAGQTAFIETAAACVVMQMALRLPIVDDIAQAMPSCQLGKRQGDEL